jgi:NhaA family Na+:H+ antiporter
VKTKNQFLSPESLAGIALLGAALLGLLIANSPLAAGYERLLRLPLEISIGEGGLSKPILLWINDGLMAVFFLLVALELKREFLDGELSKPSQIALPLAAAIGGIVVPALVYVGFNSGDPEALRGWAIPAATDIAFALGVLAMLGDRVPRSLKTFLLSLAIFDDVGAILIIAAFYTEEISWTAKGLALATTVALFLMNRAGVRRTAPYLLVGAVLWLCVLKSGVHATLAGVIVGLMIPHRGANSPGASPLTHLEHGLHPWVAFLVVPVFAFANSGVSLTGMSTGLLDPVALGIVGGLFVGKMVGVFSVSALMIRTRLAPLPAGSTWGSLFAVCVLSGIGFTMSLFIGTLAFENASRDFSAPLRIGVLAGSLLSAAVGFVLLRRATRTASAERPAPHAVESRPAPELAA